MPIDAHVSMVGAPAVGIGTMSFAQPASHIFLMPL